MSKEVLHLLHNSIPFSSEYVHCILLGNCQMDNISNFIFVIHYVTFPGVHFHSIPSNLKSLKAQFEKLSEIFCLSFPYFSYSTSSLFHFGLFFFPFSFFPELFIHFLSFQIEDFETSSFSSLFFFFFLSKLGNRTV